MADDNKAAAIAKAEEIAGKIKELAADKAEFTLAEIVPGWDDIGGVQRDLIGLEFHDRVKDGKFADVEYKGKNSSGVDTYAVK